MDLQSTLQEYVLQLKNTPRTLLAVADVVQKIMKTLFFDQKEFSDFCEIDDFFCGYHPNCPRTIATFTKVLVPV